MADSDETVGLVAPETAFGRRRAIFERKSDVYTRKQIFAFQAVN
jgi:hypothetical protein